MRIMTFLILIFASVGCEQIKGYNENIVELIEESLAVVIKDEKKSLNRIVNFVSDVDYRESKSFYEVSYAPQFSKMVSDLAIEFRTLGINSSRYKFEISEDLNEKDMVVRAFYRKYSGIDCGDLSYHNRKEYRFGCSLEYNRNISLVNSFK